MMGSPTATAPATIIAGSAAVCMVATLTSFLSNEVPEVELISLSTSTVVAIVSGCLFAGASLGWFWAWHIVLARFSDNK